MARVRDSRPAMPTADDAKENLKRLSQRIHQRRTRARETILYDLHQGVKTVEAQVHKQVEMVMSKLKDAPGSKYAFALTHTFLTQIPQALSNTILPSAISAVADTVAGRTTNSMTTLRGAAGEDEFDEEEEEEDEDELEEADEMEGLGYQQQLLFSRLRHDQRLSHQLSSEFDSIALASCSRNSSVSGPYTPSAPVTTPVSSQIESAVAGTGSVSISSTGASEFLAASTHHNYSSAASQVLNAALPSFIPSMVAPIVCVFSYPTPPASKPSSPNPLTQTSSSEPSSSSSGTNSDSGMDQTTSLESFESNPRHRAWTTAEQEGLYLAATRFKLRGQWAKIRECVNLHRTEQEIEEEYQRLYGEHDDGSDNDGDDENDYHDEHSGKVLHDDGDADDEAEAAVFMRFGGGGGQDRPSSRSATQPYVPVRPTTTRGLMDIQSLINIEPVPSPVPVPVRDLPTGVNHTKSRPQHPDSRTISQALDEKPIRVLKKEFMIDKRFALEDIPMHL
ncbi:hypothetical protein BG006_009053 [Podila minutissima]|uniref:Myb-like domain-containing protein n=1 Tax=Podila minutissima TaxID=64525 RepID=A0A9P5VQ25_9FUNG|nr:hypothetical protein BG006_009053 [Podila minutissima]